MITITIIKFVFFCEKIINQQMYLYSILCSFLFFFVKMSFDFNCRDLSIQVLAFSKVFKHVFEYLIVDKENYSSVSTDNEKKYL